VLPADPRLTVIDVIKLAMRVLRVINNHSATQAIAILILEMAVVPKRPLQDTTDETPDIVWQLKSITAWFNAWKS
jgi:hypothetical protein